MQCRFQDYLLLQTDSVQVKYGEAVRGGHLAYHVDTFNSVVHMAVAITGTRTLYLQHLEGDKVVKCATELVGTVIMHRMTKL